MAGSGGGGFIRRHTMRTMVSSSTVMPKDLWSWMMAVFGLPGPPGMASMIQPTAISPTIISAMAQ